MFQLTVAFLLAVLAADKTRTIFATGRTLGDAGYAKSTDPLGYWVIAISCACTSAAAFLGAMGLTYCAVVGAGPYSDVPFFSTQGQAYLIFVSIVLALATYLTFAKRLRRLVSAAPRMRRKTFRQKKRRK